MMKRIGYCLLLLFVVLGCIPDLPVQPVPVDEGYPEGAKVTLQFSVSAGDAMPATKGLGEKPELDSLYLAVFGSSGYLKEYVKADIIEPLPTYVGSDTVLNFQATLTLSDKERSVHFIGNGPSTLDFGYATDILPQLLSENDGQAFWQMLEHVTIEGDKQTDGSYKATDETNAQFQHISLVRNFAKIVLSAAADSHFEPDSFAVFNVPSKGSVVPFDGDFIRNYQNYGFTELTDIRHYPGNLPDSTDFVGFPQEWNSRKVDVGKAVYLYERPVPTEQFLPSYVIVHGKYTDTENPEQNGWYYYKIDLAQGGSYYPIYRNFKYQVKINKILSRGHTTPEAAAASAGSADVSADITTSHLNDISDGEARLVVQPWMSYAFTKRQVNNKMLNVKFFSDVMSGDPDMSDSVTCEKLPMPDGEEDVIESVSIGHPVLASGTEKGWRTITFSTKEPGAPGTPARTQVLRVSGTYKTDNDETRTLYRDVRITLQPLQRMQLSVDSPHDTGSGIPRDTARIVRLNVGIPVDLTESMFPITFVIEPEDMSLTPDNQIPNNNLPVAAQTSISDHAGYAGKRAFQFSRTLTYAEYRTLPQSLDLDGEPIRTFTCQFKTTRKDNATTIWVANEYFSKSHVSYTNPAARKLRYFYVEARDENIEQSLVRLQFSGKVEYLKNEDGWVSYTSGSELRMKNGDRIYFRGNVASWDGADHFAVQGKVNVGGNIASLYRGDFSDEEDMPEDYGRDGGGKNWSFKSFFRDESGVIDASALVLPMTSMRSSGYREMFMGCSNLIAAPALPATTLASYCYQDMFSGCINLTTAPKLLAETLSQYCYYQMFSGCTSLNEITMTARTLGNNSLTNWVSGVASQGDFYGYVEKPALPSGNNGIPTGWVDRNEFYVKATADGTLSFTGSGLQYSKNWDDWTSDGIGSISVAADDIVRFRGVRSGGTISSTDAFNVAGNILSLAGNDYLEAVMTDSAFEGLFAGATKLVSADMLVLPDYVKSSCYKQMFSGCSALTTPPTLSVTTLAANCYEAMFQNCISLTSSPTLPAETLVDNCYKQMFSGCTKLNFVVLSATGNITANNYTDNWLENVASSGFMLKSRDLVLSIGDNSGVPTGWNPEAPFFIEAKAATCKVKINKADVRYNIDGSGWNDYTQNDEVSLSLGQKMFIQATIDDWSGKPVTVTGNFAIGGSLASLVKGNYTTTDEAIGATGWKFTEFMSGKTNLVDASYLDLPMETVGDSGYKSFFNGCTKLVNGPVMIAATKYNKEACYQMFYGCTSLKAIPSFPSTVTLTGTSIFYQMFQSCTSLSSLTEPLFNKDVSLAKGCYQDMFAHCTSIKTICDGFLPATTLVEDCYRGMFQHNTSLERAPFLLAPTLVTNCYRYMFYGCTSLNYIKCLGANLNNNDSYTQNFTTGVSSSGTFVKKAGVTKWLTGNNGIPSGWEVTEE